MSIYSKKEQIITERVRRCSQVANDAQKAFSSASNAAPKSDKPVEGGTVIATKPNDPTMG